MQQTVIHVVFGEQVTYANGFGNRISCQDSTPFFNDRLISHTAGYLFQYIRDPDTCATKGRLAMGEKVGLATMQAPQCFCFHRYDLHCFSPNLFGSLMQLLRLCVGSLRMQSLSCCKLRCVRRRGGGFQVRGGL